MNLNEILNLEKRRISLIEKVKEYGKTAQIVIYGNGEYASQVEKVLVSYGCSESVWGGGSAFCR